MQFIIVISWVRSILHTTPNYWEAFWAVKKRKTNLRNLGGRRGLVVITLTWGPGGLQFKSHWRRKNPPLVWKEKESNMFELGLSHFRCVLHGFEGFQVLGSFLLLTLLVIFFSANKERKWKMTPNPLNPKTHWKCIVCDGPYTCCCNPSEF